MTTDALNHSTTNTYDALSRLVSVTDALGNTTRFEYDQQGNQIATIDPLGHVSRNEYDERNRLIRTIDQIGAVTAFTYDLNGNTTSVTDPIGNVTRFIYDSRDRLIREVDPLGNSTTYTYDAVDNQIRKLDRLGRVTEFEYDDLDRLIEEEWISADGALANTLFYRFDAVGNLLSAIDDTTSVVYLYDERNRSQTVTSSGGGDIPTSVLTYTYDGVGNVKTVFDTVDGVAGTTTSYGYDSLNRLVELTQTGNDVANIYVTFSYNNIGQQVAIARYSGLTATGSSVDTTYAYDDANRLTSLIHSTDAGEVARYEYQYDAVSRINKLTENGHITQYHYDAKSQLRVADRPTTDLRDDETFTYDANGNRTTSSEHSEGYETAIANRLSSDGTFNYEHNAEGQMVLRTDSRTGDFRQFNWDHRGRLIEVRDVTLAGAIAQRVVFTFDSLNRRMSQGLSHIQGNHVMGRDVYFSYDRDKLILDTVITPANEDNYSTRYVHGPGIDAVLSQSSSDSSVHQWLLQDHQGSVRIVLNQSSGGTNIIDYSVYGVLRSQSAPGMSSRFLYAGREYIADLQLYYNRARVYDSIAGRFISADPAGLVAGSNPYSYVLNNPTANTDPSGLVTWSGRLTSSSYGQILGFSVIGFRLKSECVKGKQVTVVGNASFSGVTAGIPVSFTTGKASFVDSNSSPDAGVFDGRATILSAGASGDGNPHVSSIVLGGASSFSFGSVSGIDLSVFGGIGTSKVSRSRTSKCECES